MHILTPILGSALQLVASVSDLIPSPRAVQPGSGRMVWSGRVCADAALLRVAAAAAEDLGACAGRPGSVAERPGPGDLVLALDAAVPGYRLEVGADGARLSGATPAAIALGVGSVLQLVGADGTLALGTVDDAPEHAWRVLMLDVARRHHTLDEIRQLVQVCRFYKLSHLQLHLTDDQNFMFPSTRFPRLGAGNRSKQPPYARAELEELVRFATARGVVLVPEIEVPGHCTRLREDHAEAFRAAGGSLDVADAGTVAAVCTLLDEVCAVFPEAPVHVGCDESGVGTAALCGFITRLHAHLATHGRQTLVWEGFGPGGEVPADVLVLAWDNSYHPAGALVGKHRVLNGTWDPCYAVEHYPLDNMTWAPPEHLLRWAPEAFRTFARAGSEPVVADARRVEGGFLCWWEGQGRNALPVLRRRIAAFAEATWAGPRKATPEAFAPRAAALDARVDDLLFPVGCSFSRAVHVTPTRFPGTQGVSFAHAFEATVTLSFHAHAAGEIHASVDGGGFVPVPDDGLEITRDARVDVALFRTGAMVGRSRTLFLRRLERAPGNLAHGKPVTCDGLSDPLHPEALLTDGNRERLAQCLRYPVPIAFTVDLQAAVEAREVRVFAFHGGKDDRERYVVDVSADGAAWTRIADRREGPPASKDGEGHDVPASAGKIRFVRVTSFGHTKIPGTMSRLVEIEVR